MAYQQNSQNNQYMANSNPSNINGFTTAPPAFQPIKSQQQINYQNFQTSAIKAQQPVLTNGNGNGNGSALSSRTASPAMMAKNQPPPILSQTPQIPTSQLPPSNIRPNNVANYNVNSSQPSQFGMAPAPNMLITQGNNANNNVNKPLTTNGPGSLSTPNINQMANQIPLTTSMQNLNVNDRQSHPTLMSNSINNNNIQSNTPKMAITKFSAPQNSPSFAQPMQGQNFMPPAIKQPTVQGKRPLYPTNGPVQQMPGIQSQSQPQQFNSAPQPNNNHQINQNYPVQQAPANPQNMQYQNLQPHPTQQPQQQAQSVVSSGFNKLWGNETVDLMQQRHVLPTTKVQPPPIKLNHHFQEAINCNPE